MSPPRTIFLSRLIGLYCVLAALTMLLHKQATVMAVNGAINNAGLRLFIGAAVLAAGLAIVLAHNVWSGSTASVVVTVVGWLTILKGIVYLILTPVEAEHYMNALNYDQMFYIYMAVTLLLGFYLTFEGFRRSG